MRVKVRARVRVRGRGRGRGRGRRLVATGDVDLVHAVVEAPG